MVSQLLAEAVRAALRSNEGAKQKLCPWLSSATLALHVHATHEGTVLCMYYPP